MEILNKEKKHLFTRSFLLALFLLIFGLSSNAKITKALLYPPPQEKKYAYIYVDKSPVDLVIYFNGSGCDEKLFLESYKYGGLDLLDSGDKYRKDLVFVNFRYEPNDHWSSPEITKETIEWIKLVAKKFNAKKIMLIGVSMGGTIALNVLTLSDDELKSKISKVLAVFPVVDYEYTFNHTKNEDVKSSLKEHFYNSKNPGEYMKKSSPITYVSIIPDSTKIILVEAKYDTHVYSYPIETYYKKLMADKKNVELVTWNTGHSIIHSVSKYEKLVKGFLK